MQISLAVNGLYVNTENAVVFAILTYKLSCLTVGSLFCFLGYKLFVLGIWGSSGDLDTRFGNNTLVLKNAAPGTFFAVLGSAIVVATVIQGINYDWQKGTDFSSLSSKKTVAQPDDAPPLPTKK